MPSLTTCTAWRSSGVSGSLHRCCSASYLDGGVRVVAQGLACLGMRSRSRSGRRAAHHQETVHLPRRQRMQGLALVAAQAARIDHHRQAGGEQGFGQRSPGGVGAPGSLRGLYGSRAIRRRQLRRRQPLQAFALPSERQPLGAQFVGQPPRYGGLARAS